MNDIVRKYTKYYTQTNGQIYPTEWLIRTFKGTYPDLRFSPKNFSGKNLLELGFGDGRNMPLFNEFGCRLYGVEISKEICAAAESRLKNLNISCDLRVGFNHAAPFPDLMFDCIVASHSFYYVKSGGIFRDNLNEVNRLLKPGGWFIFDLVDIDCFLFKGATHLGKNLYQCKNDPFGGIRDGAFFQAFNSRTEVLDFFSMTFENFSFGYQKNDFYGTQQNIILVVCQKRS